MHILVPFAAIVLAGPTLAAAQCILANPSFEIAGSGQGLFGGWNQFGVVRATQQSSHGKSAVVVEGPDSGAWGVSAVWQLVESQPGDRWSASVVVSHSSLRPLTNASAAILNIEWRDQYGALISYESHTAANPLTQVDAPEKFSVESGPAPPGTVATHFLLGVLQGPSEPSPEVTFDQATFARVPAASEPEQQWLDFPNSRIIQFGGLTWRPKGPGFYDPGSSFFCDQSDCVWVDAQGRLHMKVQTIDGSWHSTEVALEDALGYGDYVFTTYGRLDQWHPNIVLGLFLWEYGPCYVPANGWWNPYNEIDIEFSRWGDPANDVAQFVAQPYDWPGNISRFDTTFTDDELTSHAFRWLFDRVEFRSWRGGPQDESPSTLIHAWTYEGPHLPRPEQPRVHLNFWRFGASPAVEQEVVFDQFTFVPECSGPLCDPVTAVSPGVRPTISLLTARPNPFNPATTIHYEVREPTSLQITVFDTRGRKVRTLVGGNVSAGQFSVSWDGRDESGRGLASGVYLIQLRSASIVETRSVTLLK